MALVLAIIGAYGAMAVALGVGMLFMVRRPIGRHNIALHHRQSSKAFTLF